MNLTKEHLKLIQNAIARLECGLCDFIKECQSNKHTYCKEVGKWLKEIKEEDK